jgi:hypothetical protein
MDGAPRGPPPRVLRALEADVNAVFVASIFWSSQRNRMLDCAHRNELMHRRSS